MEGVNTRKILRVALPCFIYHKIDQFTKTEAILGFFFFECLLPMSEGDLKSIKTRMFALCRRLTIVIHGPKCFSSSKNAQEQKAMKRKLIPSLLNNFFSSGRNLFDYFEALISVE